MLSGDVISRDSASMPIAVKSARAFSLRAVAKTCKPLEWNARASAYPMPPGLQPVIKTVFLPPIGIADYVAWECICLYRIWVGVVEPVGVLRCLLILYLDFNDNGKVLPFAGYETSITH